jgi:hypothetical protein
LTLDDSAPSGQPPSPKRAKTSVSGNDTPSDAKMPQSYCTITLIPEDPVHSKVYVVPQSKVKAWHHALLRLAADQSRGFEGLYDYVSDFYEKNKVPDNERPKYQLNLDGTPNEKEPVEKCADLFSVLTGGLKEYENNLPLCLDNELITTSYLIYTFY